MRKVCIIVSIFLFLIGCSEHAMNNNDIIVKGCVIDSITKFPIPNAKITVLCWYHTRWDKTDYVSIDTIADINGCYSAKFEEGYKVVVASKAAKYYPNFRVYEELDKNNIQLDLQLSRSLKTDTTQSKTNLRYYIIQNSSN